MGRKNTLKCTEYRRKPLMALKTYWIYFFKVSDKPIFVTANMVEENDTSLVFKIIYEGSENIEESEEIVAIFKDWDFFTLSTAEAAKI